MLLRIETVVQGLLTDLYHSCQYPLLNYLDPDEGLHKILDDDNIFVYEVPTVEKEDEQTLIAAIYFQVTSEDFGQPLLIGLPRKNLTYQVLYEHILARLPRYVSSPKDVQKWWENETFEAVNGNKGTPKLFKLNIIKYDRNGDLEITELVDDGNPLKFASMSYIGLNWHPKAKELFYNEKEAEDFVQDDSCHTKKGQKKQVIRLEERLEVFNEKWRPKQFTAFNKTFFDMGIMRNNLIYKWVYVLATPDEAKHFYFHAYVKDNNGENVETYYRQVRSLVESHEDVIEKENCVIIGVKSAKKLIKPGTNQVDFSLKIRSLKEEAKDDSDESGIDD